MSINKSTLFISFMIVMFSFLFVTPITSVVHASPSPYVSIIEPSGGSYWVGDEMTIRWNSVNQHHFLLELYEGTTSVGIIHFDDTLTNDEHFIWSIPEVIHDNDGNPHIINGTNYKIKMVVWSDNYHDAPLYPDYSSYLEIRPKVDVELIKPTGGNFEVGETIEIRWDSVNQHHFLLELYEGTTSVGIIHFDDKLTNDEYFIWSIPTVIHDNDGNPHIINGTNYKIKIVVWSDNYHAAPEDYDDSNYLTIKPKESKPTVWIENCPSNTLSDSSYTFKWKGEDEDGAISKYYAELNDSSPDSVTYSTSAAYDFDYNGRYDFYVKAVDNDGNYSTIESCSIYVDVATATEKPIVSITQPNSGTTTDAQSIYVYGTANDPDGGSINQVQIRVNGGYWLAANGLANWSRTVTLQNGDNSIEVRAKDEEGEYSLTKSVTVRSNLQISQKPIVNINGPNSGETTDSASIFVYGTANDPAGGIITQVQIRVNSANWMNANGTANWSKAVALQNGSNSIYARAKDDEGDYSSVQSIIITKETVVGEDKAHFVSETIYDGLPLNGNSTFTKTWTIKNTGTTTWNSGYKLRHVSGNLSSNQSDRFISGNVPPGSVYEFSVDMTTPNSSSQDEEYKENWEFLNPNGNVVMIDNSSILYVQIVVRGNNNPVSDDGWVPYSDGFDYPFEGKITQSSKEEWWDMQDFTANNHLGEDWNYNWGNSDLNKPIYAIANGKVIYAGDAGEKWNGVIIIEHRIPETGEIYSSLYGHLDKNKVTNWVSENVWVYRGQQIGVIGDTPVGSTGPHLHFELRTRFDDAPGPGYSSNTQGWTDPSNYINAHRPEPDPDSQIPSLMQEYIDNGIIIDQESDESDDGRSVYNRYFIEKKSSFGDMLIKALEHEAQDASINNSGVEIEYARNEIISMMQSESEPNEPITRLRALEYTVAAHDILFPSDQNGYDASTWYDPYGIGVFEDVKSGSAGFDIAQKGYAKKLTSGFQKDGKRYFYPDRWVYRMDAVAFVDKLMEIIRARVAYKNLQIKLNETLREQFEIIPGYESKVTVETIWPGSDIDMEIATPSGQILTPTDPMVEEFYDGETKEYYIINTNEGGIWTVDLLGVDVDPTGEAFQFTADVEQKREPGVKMEWIDNEFPLKKAQRTVPAGYNDPSWSQYINHPGQYVQSGIHVDHKGHIHLAGIAEDELLAINPSNGDMGFRDNITAIYYRKFQNGVWSEQEEPVSYTNRSTSYTQIPKHDIKELYLATDVSGDVHMVYAHEDINSDVAEIHYQVRKNGQWSDPVNISNTPTGESNYPKVLVDSQGVVYALWRERDTAGNKQIHYRTFQDGTWGPVQVIPAFSASGFHAVMDASDVVHVVGFGKNASDTYETRVVRLEDGTQTQPEVVADGYYANILVHNFQGVTYITGTVYDSSAGINNVHLFMKNNGSWAHSGLTWPECKASSGLYLWQDKASNIHGVYTGMDQGQERMLERYFDGSTWSDYRVLMDREARPNYVVHGGTGVLSAAWEDDDVDNKDNIRVAHVDYSDLTQTPPILSVSPLSLNIFNGEGDATLSVTNQGTGSMNWNARIEEGGSWLEIDSGNSGTDSGTISLSYVANEGQQRIGSVVITSDGAQNSPLIVEINQDAGDSDSDNLPDSWEMEHFGDLSHDGTVDTDEDGVSDADEYENGTNPTQKADADNDGMPDDWETMHGFNPNDGTDAWYDSDNDGISNYQEYQNGSNPGAKDYFMTSGSVSFSGDQTGQLYIAAYTVTDTNFETPIGEQVHDWGTVIENTEFSLSVPNGSYVLRAFLDTDSDGLPDMDEPQGKYAETIVISGADDTMFRNFGLTVPAGSGTHDMTKIFASDAEELDWFGVEAAIDGDNAVVGAPEYSDAGGKGAAYVYERDGEFWVQVAKLSASDGIAGDRFGLSVDIFGDEVIVSNSHATPVDADHTNYAGSAYIFVKPENGWKDMTETAKLTFRNGAVSPPLANSSYQFVKHAVALSDEYALVGADYVTEVGGGEGAVYVYEKPVGGWRNMPETFRLSADDTQNGARFGQSLDVSGDHIIVGAPQYNGGHRKSGTAYIFERESTAWTLKQQLTRIDAEKFDYFGGKVSIDGRHAAIGAYNAGDENQGIVFVYELRNDRWEKAAELSPDDALLGDRFSKNGVVITEDYVFAASYYANDGTGAVYGFRKPAGGWKDMTQTIKLVPDDAKKGYRFGVSIDYADGWLITGAYKDGDKGNSAGAAYLVRLTPEFPQNTVTIQPSADAIKTGGSFRTEIIIDGTDIWAAHIRCRADANAIELYDGGVYGSLMPLRHRFKLPIETNPINGTWEGVLALKHPAEPVSGEGAFARNIRYKALPGVYGKVDISCEVTLTDRMGNILPVDVIGGTIVIDDGIHGGDNIIEGTVTYPDGSPASGIDVTISLGGKEYTVQTDENGHYRFEDLRDPLDWQEYKVEATNGDFRAEATVDSVEDSPVSVPLEILNTMLADLNKDMVVDIADFTLLADSFGLSEGDDGYDERADIKPDGTINIQDLALLGSHWDI